MSEDSFNIRQEINQVRLDNHESNNDQIKSSANSASKSSKPPKRPPILPNEIKCILLQGFGSIKQLKAISIPRPKPSDGEVLVHVKSW
jgi:hypothetical protein